MDSCQCQEEEDLPDWAREASEALRLQTEPLPLCPVEHDPPLNPCMPLPTSSLGQEHEIVRSLHMALMTLELWDDDDDNDDDKEDDDATATTNAETTRVNEALP